jgi:4-amino-4-deoxychorismate lyase
VWEQTSYWIDGKRAEALPLPDRGLEYGDGLFETCLFANKQLFYPERHLQRLSQGLDRLAFPDCLDAVQHHLDIVLEELNQANVQQATLRLTVTRGDGPRGYAPSADSCPRVVICVTPNNTDWRVQAHPAQLDLAATHWSAQPLLAGIKHLNRLEQVMAGRERILAGTDEMVMTDSSDHAVSVISGNLFAVANGRIITPALKDSGVSGTRRQLLIDSWAPTLGIAVEEGSLSVAALKQADELFYTNALVGLRPVNRFQSQRWSSYPVCTALHRVYTGENL